MPQMRMDLDAPARRRRPARERAEAWLRRQHAAGVRGAAEYEQAFEADGGIDALGFSWRSVRRAASDMSDFARPHGRPRREGFGPGGRWVWRLEYAWLAREPVGDRNRRRRVPRPPDLAAWLARVVPARGVELAVVAERAARYVPRAVCKHRRATAREVAEQAIRRAAREGTVTIRRRRGMAYLHPGPLVVAMQERAAAARACAQLAPLPEQRGPYDAEVFRQLTLAPPGYENVPVFRAGLATAYAAVSETAWARLASRRRLVALGRGVPALIVDA